MADTSRITQLPETAELRHRTALDAYARGDYQDALRLGRRLIEEDFNHANALVGAIYEEGGHGVEQNFQKARFYYQRAIETVGSVEGWLGLGRLYFFGKGVPKDLEKAASYYKAVNEDADNAVAQLMLGRIHAERGGPLHNPDAARKFLSEAARKGSVFATTHLALLERDEGNAIVSIWLRLKAAALAFVVSKRDSTDPRLRQC